VVSSANLGGLGAKEGVPVVCKWEPPPPPPPPPPRVVVAATTALRILLPLLLLLPLFLLRINRSLASRWIWLPLGITALVGHPLVWLASDGDQSLQGVFAGFLAGLGAVWLLMPWLGGRLRVVMFLKTALLLAGFSMLAYAPTLIAGRNSPEFWPFVAIFLGAGSLVTALALALAGFCVRRRFGRIRFVLWLTGWVVPAWAAAFSLIMVLLGGGPKWWEFVVAVLILSGVTVTMLLPLVLLSFFQAFYQARFPTWLNLPRPEPPPDLGIPPRPVEVAQAPPPD
jgi:hypothetical protein